MKKMREMKTIHTHDDENRIMMYGGFIKDDLYKTLLKEIPFEDEVFQMYGKTMIPDRKTYSMGDENLSLSYTGKLRKSNPYTKTVLEIKEKVEKELKVKFNYVLAQYYPDGKASISKHGDSIVSLKKPVIIASLTFNEDDPRRFDIEEKGGDFKKKIDLNDGDLLVMWGTTIQTDYVHQIPKQLKIKTGRINLTFRQIEN
jgi:alkylated DNA repair dioxygenase AlkB